MRADDVRNLLRVDRELAELRREVETLRRQNQTMASGFARAVMVIPTETIPAATFSGANRVCSHKPAKILDLVIRDANATWTMSEVKPSAGAGPTIKLCNPFTDRTIVADIPIPAIQMAGRSWIPLRGGGGSVIIKTPAGGIPARSAVTNIVGRADCVVQTIDSTHAIVATLRSINVCNITRQPIGGNRLGFADQEETSGRWILTVEDCF